MAETNTYKYRAVTPEGKIKEGELTAKTEREVISLLREQDSRPIEVTVIEKSSRNIEIFKKKVKTQDLAVFCRQMSTMLRAGLPLDRALATQVKQTENQKLRETLFQVDNLVRMGNTLAKSMAGFAEIFPRILIEMVSSGEMTGALDDSLERMAYQLERDARINRKIKGAMIYPAILMILTIVIAAIMLIFVIPTFVELFEGADMEMPAITRFVMNMSSGLTTYWYIVLAVIIGAVYGFRGFLTNKSGRLAFDTSKLGIPIVGKLLIQIITARFTSTLSTLLSSGIGLIDALISASETCNNTYVVKRVGEASEGIKRGEMMQKELGKTEIFPVMMLSMIGIGEETGDIDIMLAKTAEYYNEKFETAMQNLMSMLEPLMIILMAVIVGTLVIAMYLPLFSMYDAFS